QRREGFGREARVAVHRLGVGGDDVAPDRVHALEKRGDVGLVPGPEIAGVHLTPRGDGVQLGVHGCTDADWAPACAGVTAGAGTRGSPFSSAIASFSARIEPNVLRPSMRSRNSTSKCSSRASIRF